MNHVTRNARFTRCGIRKNKRPDDIEMHIARALYASELLKPAHLECDACRAIVAEVERVLGSEGRGDRGATEAYVSRHAESPRLRLRGKWSPTATAKAFGAR